MGQFFDEYRVRIGLSQIALAKKLKVTPQFISNWKQGKSDPPLRLYKKLGKILDIHMMHIQEKAADIAMAEIYEAMK